MDKRKMLERILKPLFIKAHLWVGIMPFRRFRDAFAEQATVWKVKIIHIPPSNGFGALTAIETGHQTIYFDGLHGIPGEALAIIMPLEKKDGG